VQSEVGPIQGLEWNRCEEGTFAGNPNTHVACEAEEVTNAKFREPGEM
jgi:hypothetical protein